MKKEWLLVTILFVTGMGLYAPNLNDALFFDDEHLIIDNEYVHELKLENVRHWFSENWTAGAGKLSEYYRPLLVGSLAVNYWIHGVEPFGYHLINNTLHALNAILVFWLLLLTIRKKWLAFFAALVFLIHPMQSENVAYVAARGDIMSSFFMLAGLIIWVKGFNNPVSRHIPYTSYHIPIKIISTLFSSFFLILALLSRENGIVFPFLAIIIYVSFLTRESIWRSLRDALIRTSSFLVIVAGYLALRLTVLNFRDFLNFGNVDTSSAYAQDIFVRLYTFMHVLLEYFCTFLWPDNMHFRFQFPIHTSFFDWPVWPVFLVLVGAASILIWLYKRERERVADENNIPDFRIWFFVWGWFFVALAPSSGIIPTNVIIQDHRLYLAMIGISVFGLWYGWKGVEYARARGIKFLYLLAIGALILYLGFLSWATTQRMLVWGNQTLFFEEILRYEPGAQKALNQLGVIHIRNGEYDKAEAYFRDALLRGSEDAVLFYNMGYVLHMGPKKNIDVAIRFYERSIEIDPLHWRSYRQLAEIYMKKGSPQAIDHLLAYHELYPRDANIHYNLAAMLHFLGRKNEALQWIEKGEELTVNNPDDILKFKELKSRIVSSN